MCVCEREREIGRRTGPVGEAASTTHACARLDSSFAAGVLQVSLPTPAARTCVAGCHSRCSRGGLNRRVYSSWVDAGRQTLRGLVIVKKGQVWDGPCTCHGVALYKRTQPTGSRVTASVHCRSPGCACSSRSSCHTIAAGACAAAAAAGAVTTGQRSGVCATQLPAPTCCRHSSRIESLLGRTTGHRQQGSSASPCRARLSESRHAVTVTACCGQRCCCCCQGGGIQDNRSDVLCGAGGTTLGPCQGADRYMQVRGDWGRGVHG